MKVYNGKWDTGHDEPPHRVDDIPTALRNVGVALYDETRAYAVYMRYIRGRDIHDTKSVRELQDLCKDRRLLLQDVSDVYPGPKSHPWVQESFRRRHEFLVKALEKSEVVTMFKRFLDLPKGLRLIIYEMHFDDVTPRFNAQPAITKVSHLVRRESLPMVFWYPFVLRYITKEPTIPADLLPPPGHVVSSDAKFALQEANRRFVKAPLKYTRQVRRLAIQRLATADHWADHGIWEIDLDAAKDEDRVRWEIKESHGDHYAEKDLKKMEKSIADATSRLQKCVDLIMDRDGLLVGSDAVALKNALENIKK